MDLIALFWATLHGALVALVTYAAFAFGLVGIASLTGAAERLRLGLPRPAVPLVLGLAACGLAAGFGMAALIMVLQ